MGAPADHDVRNSSLLWRSASAQTQTDDSPEGGAIDPNKSVRQFPPHRRRPVPIAGIDPGLRRDGEDRDLCGKKCRQTE